MWKPTSVSLNEDDVHSSLIQYLSTPDYSCSQSSDASLMPNSELAKQTGCLVFEFHCLLSPDHMYFAYHLLQLGQLQLACAGGGEHTWEKLYCSLSLVWALTPTCNLNKSAVSGKQWKQEEGWVLAQMLSLKTKLKTSLQKSGSIAGKSKWASSVPAFVAVPERGSSSPHGALFVVCALTDKIW